MSYIFVDGFARVTPEDIKGIIGTYDWQTDLGDGYSPPVNINVSDLADLIADEAECILNRFESCEALSGDEIESILTDCEEYADNAADEYMRNYPDIAAGTDDWGADVWCQYLSENIHRVDGISPSELGYDDSVRSVISNAGRYAMQWERDEALRDVADCYRELFRQLLSDLQDT